MAIDLLQKRRMVQLKIQIATESPVNRAFVYIMFRVFSLAIGDWGFFVP